LELNPAVELVGRIVRHRFTYWPVRLALGGEMLAPGDGSDPVQFIDVRDLAEWSIRVAEQRTTGVFNAGGPGPYPITMHQMLVEIAQGIHADPKIVWAPTSFLKANTVSAWDDVPVWMPSQGKTFGFHRKLDAFRPARLTLLGSSTVPQNRRTAKPLWEKLLPNGLEPASDH
jgi:hypothetical protein